jgi:hypothetical protein
MPSFTHTVDLKFILGFSGVKPPENIVETTRIKALELIKSLKAFCQQFSLFIGRDAFSNIVGIEVKANILINDPDNLNQKIDKFLRENLQHFPEVYSQNFGIEVTVHSPQPAYQVSLSTRPFKMDYEYNHQNRVNRTSYDFKISSVAAPKHIHHKYDAWRNITQTIDPSVLSDVINVSVGVEPTIKPAAAQNPAGFFNGPQVVEARRELLHEALTIIKDAKHQPFVNSLRDENFNRALRQACTVSEIRLVKLLVAFNQRAGLNLNFNEATKDGRTPYMLASENNPKNEELLKLLEQHSTKPSQSLDRPGQK